MVLYWIFDNNMPVLQCTHITYGQRRRMISNSNNIVVILMSLMKDQYVIR